MAGTSGSVAGTRPDAEYEILCDDNGSFLRRYTTDNGAPVLVDTTLDGTTAYVSTGTVRRCDVATANPVIDSTIQRQAGAGNVTIPVGARSVTVVVYAGNPTLAIGGGTAATLDPGTSLTWGVDRGGKVGESLQDAFVFTGVAGSNFLVTSTREI
ncbi:hypothetical protein ABT300_08975 [Streptomyces sp. NPDC001027]|uniref:hypothetical protein n=1 Tax=Streptomyces sp. NPDC001027 TaxID=3154771 RepID=UPI0033305A70